MVVLEPVFFRVRQVDSILYRDSAIQHVPEINVIKLEEKSYTLPTTLSYTISLSRRIRNYISGTDVSKTGSEDRHAVSKVIINEIESKRTTGP